MIHTEKEQMENTLLQLATRFREQAFCRYGKDCPKYEKLLQKACEADQSYYAMELTSQQREQIDALLNSRAEASDCELTLTYIAGLLDGIRMLKESGFLELYVSDENEEE